MDFRELAGVPKRVGQNVTRRFAPLKAREMDEPIGIEKEI
jgi:hypothetical protein